MKGLRVTVRDMGHPDLVRCILEPDDALNHLRALGLAAGGPRPFAVEAAYVEWILLRFDIQVSYGSLASTLKNLRENDAKSFGELRRHEDLEQVGRVNMYIEEMLDQIIHDSQCKRKVGLFEWTEEIRIVIMEAYATSPHCTVEVLE